MDHTEYMRIWRLKNKEKSSEQNRKAQKKWYDSLHKDPKKVSAYNRERYLRCRDKNLVRAKLRYAIKLGKITRLPCKICGDVKSHAHHSDYSKPYKVIWLCRQHHQKLHNRIGYTSYKKL